MKLASERLCFRELQASDADSMFALYSDPQVLRVVGENRLSMLTKCVKSSYVRGVKSRTQACRSRDSSIHSTRAKRSPSSTAACVLRAATASPMRNS